MPTGVYKRIKPVSAETRAKMSASRMGRIVTQETREKIRLAHLGEYVNITCPCGNTFSARKCISKRKKYCSLPCKYKYCITKIKGVKYNIIKKNKSWFKKNQTPWNKGLVGVMPIPSNHKGDKVGYSALHNWVERVLGKPQKCEYCGTKNGRLEWANKSHEYKREIDDWIRLCKKCHIKYDRKGNNKDWGIATQKFLIKSSRKKQ